MKRRSFLMQSAGFLAASQLPLSLLGGVVRKVSAAAPLNVRSIEITVGATKSFSALHISDTHMTKVDNRDAERKQSLASGRIRMAPLAEHYLDESIRYAKDHDMLLLHTGDLIDFVSEANLDAAAIHYNEADWFVSAGNHEYSLFVGEAKEDETYKAQSFSKVQDAYPNDLRFCSRVVNGVNFVSLDDVYYSITEAQFSRMEAEIRRGLPIVLLCHVPFYTPKHCAYGLENSGGRCAYLTGVPLDITSTYETHPDLPPEETWRNRSVQQRADKTTLEFLRWLKEQRLLKGILCGHCHYFFAERFSRTAIQYTVGATYNGDAYAVHFV